jgi:hypothetical protein
MHAFLWSRHESTTAGDCRGVRDGQDSLCQVNGQSVIGTSLRKEAADPGGNEVLLITNVGLETFSDPSSASKDVGLDSRRSPGRCSNSGSLSEGLKRIAITP